MDGNFKSYVLAVLLTENKTCLLYTVLMEDRRENLYELLDKI